MDVDYSSKAVMDQLKLASNPCTKVEKIILTPQIRLQYLQNAHYILSHHVGASIIFGEEEERQQSIQEMQVWIQRIEKVLSASTLDELQIIMSGIPKSELMFNSRRSARKCRRTFQSCISYQAYALLQNFCKE